jgi:hypothetical protein
MNWRTGKLKIGPPRAFAAIGSLTGKMVVELPFVFFNDGPMPIVIQNLRLVFSTEIQSKPLTFVATVKKLGSDEDRSFATQFPVRGREALLLICEFQRQPGGMNFEVRNYPIELHALLGDEAHWTLNITPISMQTINNSFVVRDNAA